MSETPSQPIPSPQEQPSQAYDAAYAERYGLPKPEYETPVPDPKEEPAVSREFEEDYAQRLKAVQDAQAAVELAARGEEKQRATLHLETMQDELSRYVEVYGAPGKPPIPGGDT